MERFSKFTDLRRLFSFRGEDKSLIKANRELTILQGLPTLKLLAFLLPLAFASVYLYLTIGVLYPLSRQPAGFLLLLGIPAAVLAGILSSFVFALYLFKPGVAAALAMWNQAFTSYLPFIIYPAAVGLYLYNIVVLFGSPSYKTVAVGLAVVALGGLRLEYNYFNLLALTGFLLVAIGSIKNFQSR